MSDNAVPAWASALVETVNLLRAEVQEEARQVRHRLERLEVASDRNTATLRTVSLRMTAVEYAMSATPTTIAAQSGRVDDLEARLLYIEKRLDLREGGAA